MDGLKHLVGGREFTLTLLDRTFTLTEKQLKEYAEQEQHICSLKPSPLSLLKDLPPVPPEPTIPVPPDAATQTEAQAREFQKAWLAYQNDQRRHLDALVARARIEADLLKMAQRPVIANFADEDQFEITVHGLAWRFWRAVRKHHGEEFPTYEHAWGYIAPLIKFTPDAFAIISLALEQAEGRDILKNLSAPTNGATPENNPDASPGGKSSGDLPSNTAGLPETSES